MHTDDVMLKCTLNSSNISQKESLNTVVADTGIVSSAQVPNFVYTRRKGQHQTIPLVKGQYTGPLSESIICRSFDESSVSETYPSTGTLLTMKTMQMDASGEKSVKNLLNAESQLSGQSKGLNTNNPTMVSESLLNNKASTIPQDKNSQGRFDKEVNGHSNTIVSIKSLSAQKQGSFTTFTPIAKDIPRRSELKPQIMEMENELASIFELVGCYVHPFPVLSILLSSRGDEIHICVLCGLLVKDRTLFIYKIAAREPLVGLPSFVGHTLITLPVLKDYFGRDVSHHVSTGDTFFFLYFQVCSNVCVTLWQIALERSGLQFTPDGQCLVLLDSIKMPSCRLIISGDLNYTK